MKKIKDILPKISKPTAAIIAVALVVVIFVLFIAYLSLLTSNSSKKDILQDERFRIISQDKLGGASCGDLIHVFVVEDKTTKQRYVVFKDCNGIEVVREK